jgi:hypothetical protein
MQKSVPFLGIISMQKALQSNGRKDYLFALKQELTMSLNLQAQIKECDVEIESILAEQVNQNDDKK